MQMQFKLAGNWQLSLEYVCVLCVCCAVELQHSQKLCCCSTGADPVCVFIEKRTKNKFAKVAEHKLGRVCQAASTACPSSQHKVKVSNRCACACVYVCACVRVCHETLAMVKQVSTSSQPASSGWPRSSSKCSKCPKHLVE